MKKISLIHWLFCAIILAPGLMLAQASPSPNPTGELRVRAVLTESGKHHPTPAVIWLEPLSGTPTPAFLPHGQYTLLQKNRTFVPHLLIIPVGTAVQFPNSDPFFHNVFSLFDGRRFDLGLYEAGSSKSVTFSREGVSYIFCNIHPEMSAVVLSISSPLYAIADSNEAFILPNIPAGDYNLHMWIEGVPETVTRRLTRRVHLQDRTVQLGEIPVPAVAGTAGHTNKFGNPYDSNPKPTYDK